MIFTTTSAADATVAHRQAHAHSLDKDYHRPSDVCALLTATEHPNEMATLQFSQIIE